MKKNALKWECFENAQLLSQAFAKEIKNQLTAAINLRENAYLVVSGGKTPADLFSILAQTDLMWEKVTIILADERCVKETSPDRNDYFVKKFLLQGYAKKSCLLKLYDENSALDNQIMRLQGQLAQLPTFDVVILGMGEDGHTASLFPCSPEISFAFDKHCPAALYLNPSTAPYSRISLSPQRLLNGRSHFLHIIGQKKKGNFTSGYARK